MTLTAYDTDTLNVKAILDIAQGAVVDINNAGGLNGHELELITCNEGADPNKAADCARQAVDEGVAAMVGGFTANGDAIMPILEEAGIPWFAPPGISSAELSSERQLPDHLRRARPGRARRTWRPRTAARTSRRSTTTCRRPARSASWSTSAWPAPGRRRRPDQGAADDHRLQRHRPGDQRLRLRRGRHAAAGVPRHRRRRREPGQRDHATTSSPAASPTRPPTSGGEPLEGAVTLSSFPAGDDPIWDDAKAAVGDLADDENGGWSAMFLQNTWVGYRDVPLADRRTTTTSARPASRRRWTRRPRSTPTGSRRRSASPRSSRRRGSTGSSTTRR